MARPSPLKQGRVYLDVPAGATVAELIAGAGVSAEAHYEVQAWLGDVLIPRDKWHCVKPKAGCQLVVHCIPQGGKIGKGILSIVFGIGLLLTAGFGAFASIGLLASAGGPTLAATAAIGALAIGSGIYSIAAPSPRTPFDGDIPQSNESPALQQRGNAFQRLGEPVPRQFGRWRRFPNYAAKPYTEQVGSEKFLRLLFTFGYGPLELTALKIGETPISEITTEYQILNGYDDDPDLVYFTQSVDETPLAVVLEDGDPPTTRVSALDTYEGSLDIVFPGGLIAFDEESGDPGTVEVRFTVEYRETGSGDPWTGITATAPLGPGVTNPSAGDIRIRGKKQGSVTRGVRWMYPAAEQYDVRISRDSTIVHEVDATDEITVDDATWAMLRSIRPGTKPRIANECLVEMRILATDKLGGLIEDFNAIATAVLPVWSSGEPLNDGWGADNLLSTNTSLEETRNHAWAFCHVLRGNGAQRTVANSKLDMVSIAAWANAIETDGRAFDAVIDFETSAQEVLRDIAAAARAQPSIIDGKYGVAVDEVKSTVVTAFSSRDTSNFKAAKKFRNPLHGMRVQWVDPDAGYQPDELIVYNDGYTESNATEFGRIDLFGQTDRDQAWKEGRYQIACLELRPTVYSFDIDVAGLSLLKGDRFKYAHDVIKTGVVTGRLTSVGVSGGKLVGGTLDEQIPYDVALEWGIRVRLETGDTFVGQIWTFPYPSEYFLMLPIGVGVGGSIDPQVGDLCMVGELDRETADYLVVGVAPSADLGATISCVDYAPEVFDAETGEIPPRDPTITNLQPRPLQTPGRPEVDGIASDESVLVVQRDGTIAAQIVLTVRPGIGPIPAATWQAQSQIVHDDGSVGEWVTTPQVDASTPRVEIRDVLEGAVYNVRVRAVSADGRASAWTVLTGHTVIGASSLPADVQNIRVERGAVVVWDYATPPRDFAGFRLRHQAGSSANWGSGIPAHDGYLTVSEFDLAALPVGTRTIMVKAVDLAGNESVNAAVVVKDIGGAATANIVESEDFHAGGFTGTKTNGTVEGGSGDLVADDAASTFWSGSPDADFWSGTGTNPFWNQPSLQMTYEDSWTIPGTAVPGRLVLDLEVTAGAWSVYYRINPSTTWLRWPGSVDVESAETYEFRVVTEASPAESRITAFAAVIDLPDIEEYLEDVTVASTGTVTLTLTADFTAVKQVLGTIQNQTNGGVTINVVDKSDPGAVEVQVLNAAGSRVQETCDFLVRGY